MALDKMVDSTKLDNALTATADAIREKGGVAIGSGSGAIVTVTDALAVPVAGLSVDIEPVQSGSGDPSLTNVRPISGFSAANIVVSPTTTAGDGTTYTVSFGSAGTVYGGTLDVTTGELTVTHRYMLADGVNVKTTGGYGAAGSKWLPCIVLSTADKVDPSTSIVATSYLKTSGVNVQNDENSAAHGNSGAVIALHIGTMQGTDGTHGYSSANEVHAAVNAYLQTNPLQICYKLATPQTYQFTSTEVTLLAGTNNVWSDTGNITLKYPIDSELIPFDLENETGFADAIGSISTGIEVDDIIIIGDYGLCLNNFTMSDNTCISEAGTVSGNTLIAV